MGNDLAPSPVTSLNWSPRRRRWCLWRTSQGPLGGDRPDPADNENRGRFGVWQRGDNAEWFEFNDRGNYNWDCGKVFDETCKFGGGIWQGGRDLWDGAASALCLVHVCSHAGFKENWGSIGQIFKQSPLTTAKQMWSGFSEPFVENWREGGFTKTISYALPSIIGSSLKAFKAVAKRDRDGGRDRGSETPGADDIQAHLDDARKASESGDLEAAEKAIGEAERKLADAKEKHKDAGCSIAAPPATGRDDPTLMMVTPSTMMALVPASPDDCGEAEQLAKDLGVAGGAELNSIIKSERKRLEFYKTRQGKRVSSSLNELQKLVDEAKEAADQGKEGTAKRKANQAETLANDLHRRARKEKDPQKRKQLEDAAASADTLLQKVQDQRRTAAIRNQLGDLDRIGDMRFKWGVGYKSIDELWKQHKPVINYEGTGAPYLDTKNVDSDGRPILNIDRSRYNSDAELTAAVMQALILHDNGFNKKADNGLRTVVYRENKAIDDVIGRGGYVYGATKKLSESYLPGVRTLEAQGIEPHQVEDPAMRGVYREALRYLDENDSRLYEANGRKLRGKELDRRRVALLHEGIKQSMETPLDGWGGQTPEEIFAKEYSSVIDERPERSS